MVAHFCIKYFVFFIILLYNNPMNKKIKIILISDNHRTRECLQYIRETYRDADYFLHCGDTELPPYETEGFAVVQGNNDYYGTFPMRRVLEIGKHRIYMVHGHRDMIYGRFEMLVQRAKAHDCDMVLFGHTHIYFDKVVEGVRLLNPGSIWRNRDGSKPSYMVIIFDGDEVIVERKTYEKP